MTEYLAGESLSERLRSGSIPLADAPGYTIDISDALDCAHAYIGVKRYDDAIAALERAYEQRDPELTALAVDPVFAEIRHAQPFRELTRRIGLR